MNIWNYLADILTIITRVARSRSVASRSEVKDWKALFSCPVLNFAIPGAYVSSLLTSCSHFAVELVMRPLWLGWPCKIYALFQCLPLNLLFVAPALARRCDIGVPWPVRSSTIDLRAQLLQFFSSPVRSTRRAIVVTPVVHVCVCVCVCVCVPVPVTLC